MGYIKSTYFCSATAKLRQRCLSLLIDLWSQIPFHFPAKDILRSLVFVLLPLSSFTGVLATVQEGHGGKLVR